MKLAIPCNFGIFVRLHPCYLTKYTSPDHGTITIGFLDPDYPCLDILVFLTNQRAYGYYVPRFGATQPAPWICFPHVSIMSPCVCQILLAQILVSDGDMEISNISPISYVHSTFFHAVLSFPLSWEIYFGFLSAERLFLAFPSVGSLFLVSPQLKDCFTFFPSAEKLSLAFPSLHSPLCWILPVLSF